MRKKVCTGGKNNIAGNALLYLHDFFGIDKTEICVIPVSNEAGIDGYEPPRRRAAGKQTPCE
ncbi:MAG: hypothetical protein LBP37_05950 [Spirochaetaceae bacterium]|jgi:hypothetical protein|nr:hypothetical protein [Spirochaetaceae bacterium]